MFNVSQMMFWEVRESKWRIEIFVRSIVIGVGIYITTRGHLHVQLVVLINPCKT
jgi:hypothetical protein